MSCDRRRAKLLAERSLTRSAIKNSGKRKEKTPTFNRDYLQGPGRALKSLIVKRFKVSSCDGCHTTAKEMDAVGPDEVMERLDYFAEQLHQNASKRKWLKLLDFVEHKVFNLKHYKSLIREAVTLHKIETAKRDAYLKEPLE